MRLDASPCCSAPVEVEDGWDLLVVDIEGTCTACGDICNVVQGKVLTREEEEAAAKADPDYDEDSEAYIFYSDEIDRESNL